MASSPKWFSIHMFKLLVDILAIVIKDFEYRCNYVQPWIVVSVRYEEFLDHYFSLNHKHNGKFSDSKSRKIYKRSLRSNNMSNKTWGVTSWIASIGQRWSYRQTSGDGEILKISSVRPSCIVLLYFDKVQDPLSALRVLCLGHRRFHHICG